MKTKNAKRSRRANFLAVCAVLLAVLWGGGLFLGCENTAGGGSSSRSSSGSSSGGSTTPLQVPSTADMMNDMENAIPGLKGTADETKVKDFLDALSGPAREALDRNGWTNNTGADAGKADALKALADEYATKKGATDDPVKLLNDLASNNNGKDNGNKSSDLDGFLKDTANKSGGQIDTTNTLQDLQKADGYREAVLKALSGTSPNAATSAGEAKSTALNSLGVTSADLYPLVNGLSGDANKNKLSVVPDNVIAYLVKNPNGTANTNGVSKLTAYLNDSSIDKDTVKKDLEKYAAQIVNGYNPSGSTSLKDFIQGLKDDEALLPIYQKLGSGDTVKGKEIYNKLKNAGMVAGTIAKLADNIKDMSMIQAVVAKTTNPAGATALKDYIGTDTTKLDEKISSLNIHSDELKTEYVSTTSESIADFIKRKYGSGGATGDDNRKLTGATPEAGAGITNGGVVISKGDPIPGGDGNTLGWVYKVDPVTRTAFAIGKPTNSKNGGTVASSDIAWATTGRAATDGGVPTATLDSGYDAWTAIYKWNDSAVFAYYTAIKTALIYPKTRADVADATANDKTDEARERREINEIFNGNGYENKWYLPSVKELEEVYASLNSMPNGADLKGKTFWSANVVGTSAAGQAKAVTFGDNAATTANKNKSDKLYVLPVAQFKY